MSPSTRALLQTAGVFLPLAFVGTMVHEAGHMSVAEALGYEAQLHYDSMSWWPELGAPPPNGHRVAVALGGPLTNMLIGTAGLAWLIRLRRHEDREARLTGRSWCASVLALFWSRQAFNAALALGRVGTSGEWRPSDELMLAAHWGLPAGSLSLGTGLVGLGVYAFVVLRLLPPSMTRSFLAGGLVGSMAGYGLWYGWLGPIVLP